MKREEDRKQEMEVRYEMEIEGVGRRAAEQRMRERENTSE